MAGLAGEGNLEAGELKPLLAQADGAASLGGDSKGKAVLVQEHASKVRRMVLVGEAKDQDAAEEDEKQKKAKTVVHANILESIKELGKNGLSSETVAHDVKSEEQRVIDGESPAKRSRRSPTPATPLTGAHDEPR